MTKQIERPTNVGQALQMLAREGAVPASVKQENLDVRRLISATTALVDGLLDLIDYDREHHRQMNGLVRGRAVGSSILGLILAAYGLGYNRREKEEAFARVWGQVAVSSHDEKGGLATKLMPLPPTDRGTMKALDHAIVKAAMMEMAFRAWAAGNKSETEIDGVVETAFGLWEIADGWDDGLAAKGNAAGVQAWLHFCKAMFPRMRLAEDNDQGGQS